METVPFKRGDVVRRKGDRKCSWWNQHRPNSNKEYIWICVYDQNPDHNSISLKGYDANDLGGRVRDHCTVYVDSIELDPVNQLNIDGVKLRLIEAVSMGDMKQIKSLVELLDKLIH